MFCVLKVGFCENPVSTTRGISSQLKIFFEELLRCAPNANLRTIAVKYVISIERYLTVLVARAPSSSVASAGTMITVAHALYIHGVTTMPSWFSIDWSSGPLAELLIDPRQNFEAHSHFNGKRSKEFRGAIGNERSEMNFNRFRQCSAYFDHKNELCARVDMPCG
jgi:hypothetical protein